MSSEEVDEAIRLNRELIRTGNYDVEPKFTKALKLGIEALKRCKWNYENPQRADLRRLPGETKE